MLFNSYAFIFGFLPVVLAVFFLLGRSAGPRGACAWLAAASLFFYGWWNPAYLVLLLASIGVNFSIGARLSKTPARGLLASGIAFNLGLLGYYKYADFTLAQLRSLLGTDWQWTQIVLPLAISFFTFQQIAYLMDAYRGRCREYRFLDYLLFVSFFPQLIAGPIVHHGEMMPQFRSSNCRLNFDNLAAGVTFFIIGLFKKVVVADRLAEFASPVFAAAALGHAPGFFEAWGGVLAYAGQIYFDFSGYTDMAMGLAAMIGIRLPLNFNSPYRAANIIDFWRRWHMTLSRFLRDYLYIPLGGNRKGRARRFVNLGITMVLGGIWHGAGWTFLVWGALHGAYLAVNHAWRALAEARNWPAPGRGLRGLYIALTFIAVCFGWAFFRAANLETALRVTAGLGGLNGVSISDNALAYAPFLGRLGIVFQGTGYFDTDGLLPIALALGAAFTLPNSQQIMQGWREGRRELPRWAWRPSPAWAVPIGIAALWAVVHLGSVSEFLYFQF